MKDHFCGATRLGASCARSLPYNHTASFDHGGSSVSSTWTVPVRLALESPFTRLCMPLFTSRSSLKIHGPNYSSFSSVSCNIPESYRFVNIHPGTKTNEIVGLQYILDSRQKRMQGKRQSVIVELLHKTVRKELTLRGNYNTGYEVQAIPNEVCEYLRCEQSQPEV